MEDVNEIMGVSGNKDNNPPIGGAPPTNPLSNLMITARSMAGWLKFVGVVYIISGVLSALTIIGIIVAWLPIWMGVLIYQAGDRAVFAHMQNNPGELDSMMSKLSVIDPFPLCCHKHLSR